MNNAIQTVDDLSFTSRNDAGLINWWDVEPPTTDYWPDHFDLGQVYAAEFLELLESSEEDSTNEHTFGFIASTIARNRCSEGVACGFFQAMSERLMLKEAA